MTEIFDELCRQVVEVCGPQTETVMQRVRAHVLRCVKLDAELAERRAVPLAELRSAYRERFGMAFPEPMQATLDALDPATLRLARILVETSCEQGELEARIELLEAACVEQRMAGARRVLLELAKRRFDHSVGPEHDAALRLASADQLSDCFERLESAESWDDVVGPLLVALDPEQSRARPATV